MATTRTAKSSSRATPALSSTASPFDDTAEPKGPVACADALGRTASETCRQHERLSRLNHLHVQPQELEAAHALVDTCDLALAECVATFEETCGKAKISDDPNVQSKATALWMAAREYLRRHSISEKASRQLTQHSAEKLTDLQVEYEFVASALLSLKHATAAYSALRPEAR